MAYKFTEEDLSKMGLVIQKDGSYKRGPKREIVEQVSENKKVKNATKCTADGFKFDSKLELFMYRLLKRYKVDFELKRKFVVQEGFISEGKKVRAITWSPDFLIGKTIIDTKGLATEPFKLRLKLFKKMMADKGEIYEFKFPSDQSQCLEVVLELTGQIPRRKI